MMRPGQNCKTCRALQRSESFDFNVCILKYRRDHLDDKSVEPCPHPYTIEQLSDCIKKRSRVRHIDFNNFEKCESIEGLL
jgi:hypothetical protein